jgi:hypothetical protein
LLTLAVIAASRVASSASEQAGSKFARNGKSRRDAFIGYTETTAFGDRAEAGAGAGAAAGGAQIGEEERVAVPAWCHDENESDCKGWAASGECVNNVAYMHLKCKVTCGACLVKRKTRARDGPRVFLDVRISRSSVGGGDGDGSPPVSGRIVLDLFKGTHPRRGRGKTSPSASISLRVLSDGRLGVLGSVGTMLPHRRTILTGDGATFVAREHRRRSPLFVMSQRLARVYTLMRVGTSWAPAVFLPPHGFRDLDPKP